MTYETKSITFHVIRVKVSSNSICSRPLPMNVTIESGHCGCEGGRLGPPSASSISTTI